MLDIKLRMEDLEEIEDIYSDFEMELGFTIDTLEEAIEYMKDELSGKYKEKFIEIFQEQINQLTEYRESAIELYNFVSTVIEDINDTVDIEDEQICFEYDEELFKKLVDNAEELLDSKSYDYKRIVEMSYDFEDWYNKEQNKLSIHIDSNKTLISQTASSIEEGLRLHDDKKVLNHNYNVIKKLDNKLQDINFDREIESLVELQTGLNKLELLNEYVGVQSFNGFDAISISNVRDVGAAVKSLNLTESDLNKMYLKSNMKDGKYDSHFIKIQQDEYDDNKREYVMYSWKDKSGMIHQICYREAYKYWGEENGVEKYLFKHERPENVEFDMYVTMTIPNGVLINTGDSEELVTFKNYDQYYPQYKNELNELGIYDVNDLKAIAEYNASEEGAKQLALMSLEAVRNDYPEYAELDNEELIQEMLNDPENGITTKIRENYNIDDYIDEIKYHAIGYNLNIDDTSTEMADIAPYDPNWQTLIWEALW